MPTVYVIGAWLPNGGAFMAYKVAEIAARLMRAELTVIPAGGEAAPNELFRYSERDGSATKEHFLEKHKPDDLLILNPSFQSAFYSLSVRCRIVSYVQHYTTYDHLDPGVDLFVSASHHIADRIRHQDGVGSSIISPFLPSTSGLKSMAFGEKSNTAVANFKGRPDANAAILDLVRKRAAYGGLIEVLKRAPRVELLSAIDRHKIFFTSTVSEGFGLIPLEAMSLGCIVVGLDGHGGRDYLRNEENSFVLPLQRVHELPKLVDRVFPHLNNLQYMSDAARQTAKSFTYEIFEKEWRAVLNAFL